MMQSEPDRPELRGRYAPVPGVIETDLGSELVLLDPETQLMFSLNATGRTIWRALPDYPLDAIASRLVTEFEVDIEQATEDVRMLVDELRTVGLVRLVPE